MIDITSLVLSVGVVAVVAFLFGMFLNQFLVNKNNEKMPFKEDI